jgi:hypothetical protein
MGTQPRPTYTLCPAVPNSDRRSGRQERINKYEKKKLHKMSNSKERGGGGELRK